MLLTQTPVAIVTSETSDRLSPVYVGKTSTTPRSQDKSKISRKASPKSVLRKVHSCVACLESKSTCVVDEDQPTCSACKVDGKDCILTKPSPLKKKRVVSFLEGDGETVNKSNHKKTRSFDQTTGSRMSIQGKSAVEVKAKQDSKYLSKKDKDEYIEELYETLSSQKTRHSKFTGHTSEYESILTRFCPFDSKDEYTSNIWPETGTMRSVADGIAYMLQPKSKNPLQSNQFKKIEEVVAPCRRNLIDLYFQTTHSSFPIIDQKSFLETYAQDYTSISPSLLAAIYLSALGWWDTVDSLRGKSKPNADTLARLGKDALVIEFEEPNLSTIQAALLYLQTSEQNSWTFTCQILAVAQDLGIHLDPSEWRIPVWEIRLRKILAWALFMQDKWTALTQGRPSHITTLNWDVPSLKPTDFLGRVAENKNVDYDAKITDGQRLFMEMIELSKITAEILEEFFTVQKLFPKPYGSVESVEGVLARAKPLQLRLKEWYARVPPRLRMDATVESKYNSNGSLHLSYFATEITLHRCIIRSINSSTLPYLVHICRTAAKTRLISSMDFVNRLKPEHLKSFWYSASTKNFALIGAFGSLLWATSQVSLESEFYKARLDEYRWTLQVSQKQAPFLEYAINTIDVIFGYCIEGVRAVKFEHSGAEDVMADDFFDGAVNGADMVGVDGEVQLDVDTMAAGSS